MHPPHRPRRLPRVATSRLAVWLGLGATVLHLAWASTGEPGPQFHKYPVAARALLQGTLSDERRLDFSPLYLWVTSLLEAVGLPSPAGLSLLQFALVGAAGALLVLTLRGWAGLGAGLLFCLDGGLLLHGGVQEPEVLLLFLMCGMLWAAARSPRWTGPFLALAILVRPSTLPWGLLLIAHAWRRKQERAWRMGRLAGWMVSAWGALWLWSGGGPVMNPGTVFFEGNNPASLGLSATYPPSMLLLEGTTTESSDVAHVMYRDLARAELGPQATPSDVNAFWAEKAMHHLVDAPAAALERVLTKLRVAFAPHSSHDIPSLFLAEQRIPPLLPLGVLTGLALCGVLATGRWRRNTWLLVGMVLVQTAVMLVMYASARQRLALLPPLVLLAGMSARLAWHFPSTRRRMGLMAVVLGTALCVPTSVPGDDADVMLRSLDAGNRSRRAEQLLEQGAPDRAADDVVTALAEAPWRLDEVRPSDLPLGRAALLAAARDRATSLPEPVSSFHGAYLSLLLGDAPSARQFLDRLPRGFQPVARARFCGSIHCFRAWQHLLEGREDDAKNALGKALVQRPGDPFAVALLLALRNQTEDLTPLTRPFSSVDARLLLGEACLLAHRGPCAVEHLRVLVLAFPSWRRVAVLHAAALAVSGDADEARRHYARAMELGASPVVGDAYLRPLYVGGVPADVDTAWARIRTLRQFGEKDLARATLRASQAEGLDSPALQAEATALAR